MTFALSWWSVPVLLGTGVVAGFVDSIAGGGGLITLPVMLSIGLPPATALGTNKLQATFGSTTAAWNYSRLGVVPFKDCKAGIFWTLLGAAAGTLLVQHLDAGLLRRALPALLIGIAVLVLAKPEIGASDIHPRLARGWFYALAGLGLGYYDGFFGPGTGTFWTMAFTLCLGFNMTKATGYTKVMNATSNWVSLLLFLRLGQVNYAAGLIMGVGQLIGAKIGSGMVVARGTKFIRPIFVTVVIALAIKLLYSA